MFNLKFTRQDLVTFALGAVAVIAPLLGNALATRDWSNLDDIGKWALATVSGIGAALLRYLVTYLFQRPNPPNP